MLHHFLRAYPKTSSALTFVGVAEQAISSSNSFTATYPTGTQTGDLAVICIAASNNLGSGFSCTGWTSANVETTPSGIKGQLMYRTVGTTGSQSFSASLGPTNTSYLLAVFRNATYSNYAVTTSTTTIDPPSRTGTFNAVLAFGGIAVSDSTITQPSGYTTLGEIPSGTITACGGYLISNSTNPNPGAFSGVSNGNNFSYTVGLT